MIGNLLMASGKNSVSTVDLVDPFVDGSGIALYKFDGDATDESGAYNGVASNVIYDTGKFGHCVMANGNSSVSFGVHHFLVPTTISFWVQGDTFLLQNGQFSYGYPTFYLSHVHFEMYKYQQVSPLPQRVVEFTYTHDFSVFTHVACTINYPSVKLYIDGSLMVSTTMSNNVATSLYDFGLWDVGAHGVISTNKFDQFRIFNRAITAEEVTALYNEGQS